MMLEHQIIPYKSSPPYGERILVLAPHPDDESLGCGGTLLLLREMNRHIKVVFLTSGDKADPGHPASRNQRGSEHVTDYSLMREDEALRALRIIGITDHAFLRFPDRGLRADDRSLMDRMRSIYADFRPDAIYSPSPLELNPDHRAASAIALALQKESSSPRSAGGAHSACAIVFFEVTVPLRPNLLVDVSPVYGQKKESISVYASQLAIMDYLVYIEALNTFRALTVPGADRVEAFWLLPGEEPDREMNEWVSYRRSL